VTASSVEAIFVVRYMKESHNVTYGRQVDAGGYTKDFFQLLRGPAFVADMDALFPPLTGDELAQRPITYVWPGGTAPGHYVPVSNDRPHLSWGTSDRAPLVWTMTPNPTAMTLQTIPGDPTATTLSVANAQFSSLAARGAGTPYLIAVKLFGDPYRLHVRTYLDGAAAQFAFADLRANTPEVLHDMVDGLRSNRMLAFRRFEPVDALQFDPDSFRDAWLINVSSRVLGDDAAAEGLPSDPNEEQALEDQIAAEIFGVPDATATVKTRGSAQRAFAARVKKNYGYRCALTGISTPEFLIASHIVPWSMDESIRLDPRNGICLSLLVDRAFESGLLRINDDLTVVLDHGRVDNDPDLKKQLAPFDGASLTAPAQESPKAEYLQRRRNLK